MELVVHDFEIKENERPIRFGGFFITSIVPSDAVGKIVGHADIDKLMMTADQCVGKMHSK